MKEKLFKRYEECCGCSACEQICPQKCIEMSVDKKEGFRYPLINEKKCIHCNRCRQVCPLKDNRLPQANRSAYAMIHKDNDYRYECTSSGAFEVICRNFCKDDLCAIFGVVMDENFIVKHTYTLNANCLEQFRKSKYVQSDIGESFHLVKQFLKEGRKVVFSGTPCQIDGLKHYLKKEWDNLLTIDFVCHGVPSQQTFQSYIDELSEKAGSPVKRVIFRNKVFDNGEWNCLGMQYLYENGIEENNLYPPCAYMTGFLSNLFLRPSCHECKYASMQRVSDITLGDSWGMDNYKKELSMKCTNGTSLIMMNSPKGMSLLNEEATEYQLESVPIEVLPKAQKHLEKPAEAHRCRSRFFQLSQFLSFTEAMEIATKQNRISYYRVLLREKFKRRR